MINDSAKPIEKPDRHDTGDNVENWAGFLLQVIHRRRSPLTALPNYPLGFPSERSIEKSPQFVKLKISTKNPDPNGALLI
jgi:hypothetical protein